MAATSLATAGAKSEEAYPAAAFEAAGQAIAKTLFSSADGSSNVADAQSTFM
jgi:hypothetical protein